MQQFYFIMLLKLVLPFSFVFISTTCFSQQLFIPKNIAATYQKGTRTMDGKPGKNYWQNTASYKLNISFAPATRLLSGTVDIQYINNNHW